jgi:hypothetical protein
MVAVLMPYMRNAELDTVVWFSDEPGVVEFQGARGWSVTEPPADTTPPPVVAPVADWVTLYHPELMTAHEFPNNADAIAGASSGGWLTRDELDAVHTDSPSEPVDETPSPKKKASSKTADPSEKE